MAYMSLEDRVERLERLFSDLAEEVADVEWQSRAAYLKADPKASVDVLAIDKLLNPDRPKQGPIDRLFNILPKPPR